MGDEELIARLGVDASGVRKGVDEALNAIGDLEEKGGSGVARFASKASKPLTELQQMLGTTASKVTASSRSIGEQSAAFVKLEAGLKRASTAYTTYLRAQATGTGPAGKSVSSYSLAQLEQLQATAKAGAATGGVAGVSPQFTQAINAEIAERRKANAQIAADETASEAKLASGREKANQDLIGRLRAATTQQQAEKAKQVADAEKADAKEIASNERMRNAAVAAGKRTQASIDSDRAKQTAAAEKAAAAEQKAAEKAAAAEQKAQAKTAADAEKARAKEVKDAEAATAKMLRDQTTAEAQLQRILTSRANARIAQNGPEAVVPIPGVDAKAQDLLANSPGAHGIATAEQIAAVKAMTTEMGKAAAGEKYLDQQTRANQVSLPRLRYALYDVGNAMRFGGIAAVGIGVSVLKTAADYENLYASVRRTSSLDFTSPKAQGQLDSIRKSLVDLTTQMPVTFEQATQIATLGQQLGISSAGIVSFTKTVAQFSATTNVGVEAAATAFGRLGQILHDTDYQKMGDTIAYLGVKSVATESQIISLASQLAVTTYAAKFTTAQTLALADATASLGIKPEAARGSFLRAFGQISAAVSGGGKSLNDIAAISGMTTEQFQKDWGTQGKSASAFLAFVHGLGSSSASVKQNLSALGITAARDTQAFGLLAQNKKLVDEAFSEANGTAKDGYLDKAYGVQATTVAAKLTILSNTFKALIDTLGSGSNTALGGFVGFLTSVLKILEAINANPFSATMTGLGVLLTIAAGAAALVVSQGLRLLANMIAVRQAAQDFGVTTGTLSQKLTALTGIQVGFGKAAVAGAEAMDAESRSAALLARAMQTLADNELVGYAEAMTLVNARKEQAAATEALALAEARLDAMNRGDYTMQEKAAMTNEVTAARERLTLATEQATVAEEGYAAAVGEKSLAGTAAATSGASKLGGALGKAGLVGAILLVVASLPALFQGLQSWADEMNGVTPGVDKLTKALLDLDNAKTKSQAKALLKDAIPSAPQFMGGIDSYGETMSNGKQASINPLQGAINNIAYGQSTPGGSVSLFQGSIAFDSKVATSKQQIQDLDAALTALLQKGDAQSMKAFATGLAMFEANARKAGSSTKDADAALVSVNAQLKTNQGANLAAAAAAQELAAGVDGAGEAFKGIVDAQYSSSIAAQQVSSDMSSLGEEFFKSGATVAFSGSAMTTAIASIYASSDGASDAASKFLGLFNALTKGGYASSQQLAQLAAVAKSLDPNAKAAAFSLTDFTAGVNKAAAAAEKASGSGQKELRTLVDYANDLNGVFSRAFDFRYGNQQALDAVTKGYQTLSANAKDAAANLAKVRAELEKLKGDQGVTKYQLGVANEYGDSTRAGVLRGNLAQSNADIIAKQKELTAAQEANSKALTGNSAAAIANRANVLQQVQAGQAVLASMAANGASQAELTKKAKELKAQLVDQFGQMGFNRTQVTKLAGAFDDYVKIIKSIPRNVDVKVSANTNPATVAIKEFLAKNKHLNVNVGVTPVSDPGKDKNTGVQIGEKVQSGLVQAFSKNTTGGGVLKNNAGIPMHGDSSGKHGSGGGGGFNLADVVGMAISVIWGKGFSVGGYTGDGPANQVAGVVHGREFVLNERATAMIPRQVLDSWNQGKSAVAPSITNKVNVESGSVLTRDDRMFLAAALTRAPAVQISADQFGQAVDGSFVRASQRGAN